MDVLATSPASESYARWASALEQRFLLLDDTRHPESAATPQAGALLAELCDALEAGALRMANRTASGTWKATGWLKRAVTVLGAGGSLQPQPGPLAGSESGSLGWIEARPLDRRVPAGSFLRRGACLRPGCTVMPPSTLQLGAYLGEEARVDSHALLGSAVQVQPGAQIGCGTMIGGLLLPEDSLPVILEEGAVLGGNCGIYGSVVIGQGAALYAGTVLRSVAGAFNMQSHDWLRPDSSGTLYVPANSVLEMGLPPAAAFPDGVARLCPILH